MLDWSYIINSAIWSAAGLLVGAVFGWFAREIYEVHEVLVDNPDQEKQGWDGVERRQKDGSKFDRMLGLFVIILSVVTVGGYGIAQSQRQDQVDCQTKFNTAFSKNLAERAKAASRDRQAITRLVRDTAALNANPPDDLAARQAAFQRIFQNYLDDVEEGDKLREDNPIPETPCT